MYSSHKREKNEREWTRETEMEPNWRDGKGIDFGYGFDKVIIECLKEEEQK